MYSKLAVVAVLLVAVAGAFADDFTNNCNVEKRYCQNGGVCHENIPQITGDTGSLAAWADPFCICPAGFGGQDCSRTIRECKDNPCQNGGTCAPASCINNVDSQYYDCFTCTCPYGWQGSPALSGSSNPNGLCDYKQVVQDCSVNSCSNGGTCSNVDQSVGGLTTHGYGCQCTLDYFGGNTFQGTNRAFNCTVPKCSISAGACQNGGTCLNPTSNPICSCPGGYYGDHCEFAPPCSSNPCQAGETCTNTGSTYVCTPLPFCQTHTCQNGGTCHDSGAPSPGNGGGYCSCVSPSDGMNSCNSTTFCNSNPCQNGGSCSNSLSYIGNAGTCSCPKGWVGQFCEQQLNGCGRDTVGCSPNGGACPCVDQTTCVASAWNMKCGCSGSTGGIQHFDCRCNSTTLSKCPGTGSGGSGQWTDMVCQNGGTCYEVAEAAQCSCRPGFWGDQCQNYDNPCLNSPCENGGQCYVVQETQGLPSDDRFWAWRCKCKWPYYGKNCEKVAPVSTMDGLKPVVCGANNSPCQNGGTCSANTYRTSPLNNQPTGGYFYTNPQTSFIQEAEPWQCSCPHATEQQYGYMGQMCEQLVERCTADTCKNGGHCFNSNVGPSCSCPCGYAGDRCEIMATNVNADSVAQLSNNGAGGVGYRLEFCSQAPCQNGGTCFHTNDGQNFECHCKSGWAGTYCQYSVRSAAAGVVPSLVAVAAALAVAFALKH